MGDQNQWTLVSKCVAFICWRLTLLDVAPQNDISTGCFVYNVLKSNNYHSYQDTSHRWTLRGPFCDTMMENLIQIRILWAA